jgi:hypothetical protein
MTLIIKVDHSRPESGEISGCNISLFLYEISNYAIAKFGGRVLVT